MDENHSIETPTDIKYGLTDHPPLYITFLLAIQQLFMLLSYLVLVSVLASVANFSSVMASNMISLTLIAMGIGTLLQVLHKGPVGSGYFIAVCPMPNYLEPSIIAIQTGGINLLAGMVLFSGLLQTLISFFAKKLRFLFPSTLSGIIFCLIGITLGLTGLQQILTLPAPLHSVTFNKNLTCFMVTIGSIVIFNIWGRGTLKLMCSGLGLLIGCITAILLHLIAPDKITQLHKTPWFGLPHFHLIHYTFDSKLIFIFLISCIASVLRASGAITIAQQISDAKWSRPNQNNLKKGLLADGLGAITAGILSTTGIGCTPSSIGLSKATAAISRSIAYIFVLCCFLLALSPKLGAAFFALPNSVIAGGLLFLGSILFTSGIRIVGTQKIDERKTFIICISIFVGISTKMFPHFYEQLPVVFHPITASLLSTGTLTAFILNILFRPGIARKESLVISQSNETFICSLKDKIKQLGLESANANVILNSFIKIVQAIIDERHNSSSLIGTFHYDEVNFVIELHYEGTPPSLPSIKKNFIHDDLADDNAFVEGIYSLYKEFSPDKVEYHVKDKQVNISLTFSI